MTARPRVTARYDREPGRPASGWVGVTSALSIADLPAHLTERPRLTLDAGGYLPLGVVVVTNDTCQDQKLTQEDA